jgi:hypothetical protein
LAVSSGIALTAEPNDKDDIYKALCTYYDLWKRNSLPKGSDEFVSSYDRKVLTENLSQILASSSNI